jgi:hypothetical protein
MIIEIMQVYIKVIGDISRAKYLVSLFKTLLFVTLENKM